MSRQQPLGQRDFGALKHGANGHRELFAAIGTLPEARTMGCAVKLVMTTDDATVRANRTLRPADRLKVFAGFGVVGEVRSGKVGHGFSSVSSDCPLTSWVCQVYKRPPTSHNVYYVKFWRYVAPHCRNSCLVPLLVTLADPDGRPPRQSLIDGERPSASFYDSPCRQADGIGESVANDAKVSRDTSVQLFCLSSSGLISRRYEHEHHQNQLMSIVYQNWSRQ